MADTKISALTELTAPAIDDYLVAVNDPGGTPVTKYIEFGNALQLEYGQLYTTGGSGTQVPNTSYALMSQWDSDGLSSGGVTPANASNKITVTNTGIYFVAFQLSFTGTNGSIVNAAVFWNAVEQTQTTLERKLGTGADVGSGSAVGLIDVTTGSTDIDLRVKCDGATDDFNLAEGQMIVVRIGAT